MNTILIDTNVLVYAHDRADCDKQQRAIETLDRLHLTGNGRLSAQSLGEFFRATTRGAAPLLTIADAALQVERLAQAWPVLDVTPQVVLEAVRGASVHQFSLWDAQIWAAARLNQIPLVFTEDIQAQAVVEGVRFVNPFAAGFRLEDWLA